MSETLSHDPDGLGAAYTTLAPSYPPTPATPSSTVQDVPPGSNLPPFSSFSSDMDSSGTFSSVSDRLFSDARLLDISNWDYYTETRLVERGENGLSIITSQPQYRPWESKPVDSTSAFAATTQVNTFTDAFNQNGASKLPSFQSQFQSFNDAVTTSEPTLTTLTNLTPVSPNSSSSPQSQSLTTLNSSFHTLSAVNARSYPLVPAPIQAREIPSIQQQFLDERHIQLYSHPTANLTLNNTIHSASIFPAQNGAIIQNSQIISSPTVVTVLKSEPDLKLTANLTAIHQDPSLKLQNVALHPTQFQNPMSALNSDAGLYNGIDKKINGITGTMTSPTRNDFRKKERRKIRASSLESSAESDGASSNMDLGSENSGQVAAVSSTDGFKNHHMSLGMEHEISGGTMDKQVKKKRKRCGECVGCQRKDNCGDCAPCRNDKSHQICKQRRCEKLTEKKNLYGEPYMRGESRRGRGKGRGGSSYRGRKPNGPITPLNIGGGGIPTPVEANGVTVAPPQQPPSRPSPQPPTAVAQPMPVQQQAMTPMPFYADPNRFPTPVWQADPSQGWPQGQFIQQIPPGSQPIETYQQYPNGIYQTTYQQPAFESNTFYAGAVQVLTPANARPPSVPNQQAQMVPPRPNSNYAHTPSPSPAAQQSQQQQQQSNNNRQYQEYNQFASSGSVNENSQSRPSSVNSVVNQNPPTPNQNFNQGQQQQQTVYTTVSSANFSPSSNQQTQFVNASSGNGQPGYPQVNASSPQVVSHNSSGYPGNEQFSGQDQQWHQQEQVMWSTQSQNSKMDQQIYHQQEQHQTNQDHYMPQQQQSESNSPTKMQSDNTPKTFSQADKVNLNTRIKTMILNKQQNENKIEEGVKSVEQNNPTGHFLWYSHHHHLDPLSVDGGPQNNLSISENTERRLMIDKAHRIPNNTQNIAQNKVKRPSVLESSNDKLVYNDSSAMPLSKHDNKPLPATTVTQSPSKIVIKDEPYYFNYPQDNSEILNQNNLNYKTELLDPKQEHVYERASINSNFQTHMPTDLRVKRESLLDQSSIRNPFNFEPKSVKQEPNSYISNSPNFNVQSPKMGDNFAAYHTPKYSTDIIACKTPQSPVFISPERTRSWSSEKKKDPTLSPQKSPKDKHHSPDSSENKPKISEKSSTKIGEEIPRCHCFPPDRIPPEPGAYYTHLGCANNLRTLRHNFECQTGLTGPAIRIEKVRYTGKEGKTAQGCPIVKWVHRRVSIEEKYLVIVKHRTGHVCQSAFIVICLVVWDGVPSKNSDDLYSILTNKLNKFGLPTKRRCATNDPRTCACQGINEDTCGASFSFGCSWSMYYNGCKFTRSKDVRKFRLSIKEEETEVEEKLQSLADLVGPIYRSLAPQSFKNQTHFENVASDCRLGTQPGRPFSGVTACIDFCAHAHKDIHNMTNGCTVVVTLTKHRELTKPEEEQLHVLPLYVPDDTDEFGTSENQELKVRRGEIEVLNKYECEIRTFSEPAATCRNRKGKKEEGQRKRKSSNSQPSSPSVSSTSFQNLRKESPVTCSSSSEIQSGQVSSTVLDSPNKNSWRYDNFSNSSINSYENSIGMHSNGNNFSSHLPQFSVFKTPYSYNYSGFSNHYNQDGYLNNHSNSYYPYQSYNTHHTTPNLLSHYNSQYTPLHRTNNPFDDHYSNNILPNATESKVGDGGSKQKSVEIKYTDNSECFKDLDIGGVAIALTHGSILFECAKHELHATTALKKPDRTNPTRISLVFYQHRSLNKTQHGLDEYTLKQKSKLDGAQPEQVEFDSSFDSSLSSSLEKLSGEMVLRTATLPTVSVTTMFPMYPCMVTGPYQEFLASSLPMQNK